MSLLKMYRSRKYLHRILISISLLMVLFLFITSTALYYIARSQMLDQTHSANQKVMYQFSNNLYQTNEMVKNLATSMYYNNDMVALMNSKSLEIFDVINRQSELDRIVHSSSFLQSIMFYNGYLDKFYYGTNAGSSDELLFQKIRQFLKKPDQVKKMQLIPLVSPNMEDGTADVVSYFMYNSLGGYSLKESILIMNVKPQWLFDTINKINTLSHLEESHVFLMSSNGQMINSEHKQLSLTLKNEIQERMRAGKAADYFIYKDKGDTQVITYLTTEVNQWIVVNVQPYSSILGSVNKMRDTSIVVTLIFLVLSLILSTVVSHKLYRPINGLFTQFSPGPDTMEPAKNKDEISYMSTIHSQITEKLKMIQKEQDTKFNIVENYHLKQLITDSSLVTLAEWKDFLGENSFLINGKYKLLLCLLKIDDYKAFKERLSTQDQKLISFAIGNIADEIVGSQYPCKTVEMRNDEYIILIGLPTTPGRSAAEIHTRLQEVQSIIYDYYRFSLTVAISEEVGQCLELSKQYLYAQKVAKYRLIFGKMALIHPAMISEHMNNPDFQITNELKKKLAEGIKSSQDGEQLSELLQTIFQKIHKFDYDNIIHTILDLVGLVKTTLVEMNNNKLQTLDVDLTIFIQRILEKETLEEIFELFKQLITDISNKQDGLSEDRNHILIATIKEIIETNYYDMNLNLQGIASILKMSPVYIGRVFKQSENTTLSEFINDIRLGVALKLLQDKSYSINIVMEKVGYVNQSYFFRLFKKKFGTTPKEYRLKKSIT
ncbi:AraC family transcriptional regulator [Paenibacillus psychroresistens]|uniref:AraC family transcriptional regulator n=1 Tax=Paenibacillus psychroresistens TaxID=1778678 RepID=A0A6B8RTM7_9BACL|nr:helix-turn-helix domain-containing protein [Paenibacillus psychroresistens]QGQ99259.1 AraC family transcriptional regulator [Paenibacillus psychroresistens]